jgi:tetratricopeptide (TPR) repeat protein
MEYVIWYDYCLLIQQGTKMKLTKIITILFFSTSFLWADELSTKLEDSLKSSKATNAVEESKRLSALGGLNHQNGDYETALKYYDQSISLLKTSGNAENMNFANTLFLSAIASHRTGHSCDALKKIESVISIYKVYAPQQQILLAQEEADSVYKPACGITLSLKN